MVRRKKISVKKFKAEGSQATLFDKRPFVFGTNFLNDHAGQIINDPRLAIVELIANAYDAGSTRLDINWPRENGKRFEIADNGTGMTLDEFNKRWKTLCYNRMHEQGSVVQFPLGVNAPKRAAFGQSGKGRHSAFCFSNQYVVETWKDGQCAQVLVQRIENDKEPFHCSLQGDFRKSGHGTTVSGNLEKHYESIDEIRECVGSKFLVDPSFQIFLNGSRLDLLKLDSLETDQLEIPNQGLVLIHQIDAGRQDRTTQLRGITWWVNKRMVGHSSWDGLDERGAILDGRTTTAKRISFVIEADIIKEEVKEDWTGFHESKRTQLVKDKVREYVTRKLDNILAKTKKEKKKVALEENRTALQQLPKISRRALGQFVDEVLEKCPTLSEGDLIRTVTIFTNLEQARSGYELLEKLAKCSPNDLDTWDKLMGEWSANNAEIILGELKKRLTLIKQLQGLVNTETADELHDLQPLFARGLWIFGPEYEAVEFTSNRRMATTIWKLLGGTNDKVSNRRADFVALSDRSIGVYSADKFSAEGEVDGVREVLIVELKKGGSTIGVAELRQGEDYASELRNANLVNKMTNIIVYVLGAKLEVTEDRAIGDNTKIKPRMYDTILKRAESRTFNLLRRIEESHPEIQSDAEVEEVLAETLF